MTSIRTPLSLADLPAQITAAEPLFRMHATANAERGALAPEVFAELVRLGLQDLYVPRSSGGLEASPTEASRIVEQIAYADASTGWVAFVIASATGMAAGYLPDEGARTMFGPGPRQVAAGAGAPTGRTVRAPGGYRLSGKWSYGSGIQHANWAHVGALLFEDGTPKTGPGGLPETIILHAPCEHVRFHGNWQTLGLRATGSVDFSVDDVFVPDELIFSLAGAVPLRRAEFFGLGAINLNAIGHAAWAAGTGRRALDELAAFARGRTDPGTLGASQSFWEAYGAAEGRVRAARCLLYDVWGRVEAGLARGDNLSTRDTSEIRLALLTVTGAAVDAADLAYRSAGGTSLREGILQQLFRDLHSGAQHITVSPGVLQACGRQFAGLAGNRIWELYRLVDPK